MRVLLGCLDQDGDGLLHGLRAEGHCPDLAEPFAELPAIAQHNGPYDVVVAAVSDCRAQALPVLRDIRRRGLRLPVMVIAAAPAARDEEETLQAGADDVLAWPVQLPVLVARLQGMVRRTLGHASAVVACGNVTLDQSRRLVAVDGRPVRITRREFDVLETLMLRGGALLTKEHAMSRLYGAEDGPDPRILDVFVCKLRRKLAAAGAAEIVRTVWGHGYVVEEPCPAAVAAARARFAAGQPRQPRAHAAQGAGRLVPSA